MTYNVAAVLTSQFLLHVMLFRTLNTFCTVTLLLLLFPCLFPYMSKSCVKTPYLYVAVCYVVVTVKLWFEIGYAITYLWAFG